jgi:hypothetical protein
MYRWLRNVHLAAGLFSAVSLLVFGATALQMAYGLPGPNSSETTTTIDVPSGYQVNPRAFAWWLMERHGLRGDLVNVTTKGAVVELTIQRTGASHRVEYDSHRNSAQVTTISRNTLGMFNRIHHAGGIEHQYWAINRLGLDAVGLVDRAPAAGGIRRGDVVQALRRSPPGRARRQRGSRVGSDAVSADATPLSPSDF